MASFLGELQSAWGELDEAVVGGLVEEVDGHPEGRGGAGDLELVQEADHRQLHLHARHVLPHARPRPRRKRNETVRLLTVFPWLGPSIRIEYFWLIEVERVVKQANQVGGYDGAFGHIIGADSHVILGHPKKMAVGS